MLTVAETFSSLQGEGLSVGVQAFFIRFMGCNADCSFCDSAFTWDGSEKGKKLAVKELLHLVQISGCPMVVITGGEPMLYWTKPEFDELLRGIKALGKRVEIETNGTTVPVLEMIHGFDAQYLLVDQWNVSPKLASSGVKEHIRFSRTMCGKWVSFADSVFRDNADTIVCFKFVVDASSKEIAISDLDEIQMNMTEIYTPNTAVLVMPEGTSVESQLSGMRVLWDLLPIYGYRLSPRLHTLTFGAERLR
jgi:organic radical activating enzyme